MRSSTELRCLILIMAVRGAAIKVEKQSSLDGMPDLERENAVMCRMGYEADYCGCI